MSVEEPPDDRVQRAAANADGWARPEEGAERFVDQLDRMPERIYLSVVMDVAQLSVAQIDHTFKGLRLVIEAARDR